MGNWDKVGRRIGGEIDGKQLTLEVRQTGAGI